MTAGTQYCLPFLAHEGFGETVRSELIASHL